MQGRACTDNHCAFPVLFLGLRDKLPGRVGQVDGQPRLVAWAVQDDVSAGAVEDGDISDHVFAHDMGMLVELEIQDQLSLRFWEDRKDGCDSDEKKEGPGSMIGHDKFRIDLVVEDGKGDGAGAMMRPIGVIDCLRAGGWRRPCGSLLS